MGTLHRLRSFALRRSGSARARRAQRTSTATRLRTLTRGFAQASTPPARHRRAVALFAFLWATRDPETSARAAALATTRLSRWLRMLERDPGLRAEFLHTWHSLLGSLDLVPLLSETGLPSHHALSAEVVRRLFERLLPSAREPSDAVRLLAAVFPSPAAVQRLLITLDAPGLAGRPALFPRLQQLLFSAPPATAHLRDSARQALCLLAARIAGRGASPAIRRRGSVRDATDSPFFQLLFSTQSLVDALDTPLRLSAEYATWSALVTRCSDELEQVHLHMEDAGVSSALVYDLRSIEASLARMQALTTALQPSSPELLPLLPLRALTAELLLGRLADTQLRSLVRDNLTLLARKTVERTGHGGEHYIAHSSREYWLMWRAGIGGGLLTVFTAAVKMRLMEQHFPLFIEGFLIGTDYAISFLLLGVFGFALATKQPSMTAATLAGIIRENRGVARWSKISDFAADICRTQLAAAFSNVLAVCAGAVVFEELWEHVFRITYLPAASAEHVYQTLHPFSSGTALFAAVTGVLLWLAAVIGGWFENFAVFHRIPEAIAQHPLGHRLGARPMRRAARWLDRNAAGWSTSIVLGYLLGFTPVLARFFGIPLDVRHVTLSTGTLALAAARFGTEGFRHGWLYYAIAGIGLTFIFNLTVSFSIASAVALRAYNVPAREQLRILGFLLREILSSPLHFVFPPDEPHSISISPNAPHTTPAASLQDDEAHPPIPRAS